MLTIFSIPKPFQGHIGTIQRNAITSWTLLSPKPEIALVGNEHGTSAICEELGLLHIPEIACNEFGTPLVNSIFSEVQKRATFQQLCYINADIILLNDFIEAVRRLNTWNPHSVMVGARRDLDVTQLIDFKAGDWMQKLSDEAQRNGQDMTWSSDYFIFPRDYYSNMPSFAVGRVAYDNWFLWKASRQTILVDATKCVLAIHQNHDSPAQWAQRSNGLEAKNNKRLAGKWAQSFSLADATHCLQHDGVKKRLLKAYVHRANVGYKIAISEAKAKVRQLLGRT